MLVNALLNELFNVFPNMFHVKSVSMGYVELPKTLKSDYITNKQTNMLLLVLIDFKSAHLIITENNSFAV